MCALGGVAIAAQPLSGWGHIAHRYSNYSDHHRSNTGTFRIARDLETSEQ